MSHRLNYRYSGMNAGIQAMDGSSPLSEGA